MEREVEFTFAERQDTVKYISAALEFWSALMCRPKAFVGWQKSVDIANIKCNLSQQIRIYNKPYLGKVFFN